MFSVEKKAVGRLSESAIQRTNPKRLTSKPNILFDSKPSLRDGVSLHLLITFQLQLFCLQLQLFPLPKPFSRLGRGRESSQVLLGSIQTFNLQLVGGQGHLDIVRSELPKSDKER